jgi:hypothetical protein
LLSVERDERGAVLLRYGSIDGVGAAQARGRGQADRTIRQRFIHWHERLTTPGTQCCRQRDGASSIVKGARDGSGYLNHK